MKWLKRQDRKFYTEMYNTLVDSFYNTECFKKELENALKQNFPVDFKPTKKYDTLLYIALYTQTYGMAKNAVSFCHNLQIAKELLKAGADIHSRNRYGENALMIALQTKPDTELMRMILDQMSEDEINTDTVMINDVPYDTDVMRIALGNCLATENEEKYIDYLQCIKLLLDYGYDYQKILPLKEYAYNVISVIDLTWFMHSNEPAKNDRLEKTVGYISNLIATREELANKREEAYSYEL